MSGCVVEELVLMLLLICYYSYCYLILSFKDLIAQSSLLNAGVSFSRA